MAYGEVEVQLHVFLISTLDGGRWSASRAGERAPDTHWIGDWVVPRVGLDALEMPGIEPRSSRP
jgi:hypothetical protein